MLTLDEIYAQGVDYAARFMGSYPENAAEAAHRMVPKYRVVPKGDRHVPRHIEGETGPWVLVCEHLSPSTSLPFLYFRANDLISNGVERLWRGHDYSVPLKMPKSLDTKRPRRKIVLDL